jgi:hypothetical protein
MKTVIPFRKSGDRAAVHAARRYIARLERYPMLPRERRPRASLGAKLRQALARLGLRRARA